jgi:C1A family cysteine protease
MSEQNYIVSLGAIPSEKDVRDYKGIAKTSNFPTEYELKMVRVKNQGSTSSCVAHAISSVIEYFNSVQNGDKTEMSTGYIYGNRENSTHKGEGMIVKKAIAAACEYGDVPKSVFPGNEEVPTVIEEFKKVKDSLYTKGQPSRFTSYFKLNSKNDIKASLMNNGPVIMSMKWYDDIKVKKGVITTECGTSDGNHCMVIYGWNEEGWKILNSWGLGWGNLGKAILPYDVPLREAWGIIDTYTNQNLKDFDIEKPFSSSIGEIIAKIINAIMKLLSK